MMELIYSGDVWALLGGGALVAVAVLALRRKLELWSGVVAGVLVVCGVVGTVLYAPHPGDALVVEEAVAMQVSPIDGGEERGELAIGDRVRVENRHGGYAYVRSGGGEAGWVPTVKLERFFGEWGE
ncbi:MAG: hypothetical protein P8J87_02875 [Verrucomicrobiales bacterium]|nr:hypothetical protein [Verrucomicrobiales bacterium]